VAELLSPLHADLAVIGAGPAGIASATRAAEAGLDVLLLESAPRPGGQIWRHRSPSELPASARHWLARLGRSRARLLCGTTVVDAAVSPDGAPFHLSAEQNGAPLAIRARRLILATGARERFLPFPGWTLPGVFGVGGAQALLKSGMAVAGKRVVVAGTGPLLLAVGAALARAGAELALVAEQAPLPALLRFAASLWRAPGRALQGGRYRASLGGARYAAGCWVLRAAGDDRVREVTLTDGRRTWTEPCDLLCTGYGLVPNLELPHLLGCATENGVVRVNDVQETTVPGVFSAGEPTGIAGVDAALVEGEIAALTAAELSTEAARLFPARAHEHAFARRLERAFALRGELRALPDAETIVCRCEDVTRGQLDAAWCFRQAKLYTRIGMGPCQARVCGPALEYLFGWSTDSPRIPVAPTSVGALVDTLAADRAEGER
jgi:NADPH-dependent 2,4-dienoyl-CoA reductase/sulfur reductase-like enzyme